MAVSLSISNFDDSMNRDFLKFTISIAGLLLLVLIGDRGLAVIEDKAFRKIETKINYVTYGIHEDEIVVFGSSRARHHYMPSIINKETGKTCVNLGMDGQNIYYSTALLHLYLRHNNPKLVVLDLFEIDFEKTSKNFKTERLNDLSPIYGINAKVDSIISLKKGYDTQVEMFHTYKYNSKIASLLFNPFEMRKRGFSPVYGETFEIPKREDVNSDFDEDKLKCINEFITTCRKHNSTVCVIFSPALYDKQSDRKALDNIVFFCEKSGASKVYNYEHAITDRRMFKDILHLNIKGAEAYSVMVSKELTMLLKNLE